MKTVVIILTPLGLENNIPSIKEEIVKYVGNRLIKDDAPDAPLLELNDFISKEDKERICEISKNILNDSGILYIESEDDRFGDSTSMCVLQPKFFENE